MKSESLFQHPARRRWSSLGFTLIELMIAMIVVAVLATVALPSYQNQVRKSRRADAIGALSQITQAQERWRANNPAYTTNLGTDGLSVSAAAPSVASYTIPSGYYALAVSAASSSSYTATATAAGAQSIDTACTTFTLTVSGAQLTYTATPAANAALCWRR